MTRPDYLRDAPLHDRGEFTGMHHHKWVPWVADLFCGKGGVGRTLDQLYLRENYFGIDIENYGDEYPGQFIQADLINNPPISFPTAHLIWVSFPCNAYSNLSCIEYGSREAALEQNPRIPESGIRELAREMGCHYIIENVPGATRTGDLKANVRLNGLAFDLPFSMERHFETSFKCPDAYLEGDPDVTISTSGDQSIKDLAAAKGVPSSWGKQAVRSAMPDEYVRWLLHHCPSTPCPKPDCVDQTLTDSPKPRKIAPGGNP